VPAIILGLAISAVAMLLEAVFQRDYPVISEACLVTGVGISLINLLVDLTYGVLDARVRHQ